MSINSTINQAEIDKFTKMADDWWDPNGKFKPLHQMHATRMHYLREKLIHHFHLAQDARNILAGLSVLDIGCGGGLVSEALARLGANVTAIDATSKNIEVARLHAANSGLDIDYRNSSAEELAKTNQKYDIVVALEIIEHVDNPDLFVKSAGLLLKNNGIIFFSTINRNLKSYLFAIIGAEYVLKLLPIHTHDWNKFIKPSELLEFLTNNSLNMEDLSGMSYNIISKSWHLTNDPSVNYIMCATKHAN